MKVGDRKACRDRRLPGRSSPRNQNRCQMPPPFEHAVLGPTRRIGELLRTATMFRKAAVMTTEIYGQGSLEVLKTPNRLGIGLEVVEWTVVLTLS